MLLSSDSQQTLPKIKRRRKAIEVRCILSISVRVWFGFVEEETKYK